MLLGSLQAVTPAAAQHGLRGWTISASSTDPGLPWDAPLGVPGSVDLYLWLACDGFAPGMIAAEFAITGSLAVTQFTPMNGFVATGPVTDLVLWNAGCVTAPTLVGVLTVQDPGGGGALCFQPPAQLGRMVDVDCDTFVEYPILYRGFASDGSFPCELVDSGDATCGMPSYPPLPTSAGEGTEAASFGRVKATCR